LTPFQIVDAQAGVEIGDPETPEPVHRISKKGLVHGDEVDQMRRFPVGCVTPRERGRHRSSLERASPFLLNCVEPSATA
jgi:hypothetical protein